MIVFRECEGHDELEACVQIQVETWGYDQADVIPRKAFLVMQKIGGQIIGAFDTSLPVYSAPAIGVGVLVVGTGDVFGDPNAGGVGRCRLMTAPRSGSTTWARPYSAARR